VLFRVFQSKHDAEELSGFKGPLRVVAEIIFNVVMFGRVKHNRNCQYRLTNHVLI
jgi:hypothetical protein